MIWSVLHFSNARHWAARLWLWLGSTAVAESLYAGMQLWTEMQLLACSECVRMRMTAEVVALGLHKQRCVRLGGGYCYVRPDQRSGRCVCLRL